MSPIAHVFSSVHLWVRNRESEVKCFSECVCVTQLCDCGGMSVCLCFSDCESVCGRVCLFSAEYEVVCF